MTRRRSLLDEGDGWVRVGPRVRSARPLRRLRPTQPVETIPRRPAPSARKTSSSVLRLFPNFTGAANPTYPAALLRRRTVPSPPTRPASLPVPLPPPFNTAPKTLFDLTSFKEALLQQQTKTSIPMPLEGNRTKRPRSTTSDLTSHRSMPHNPGKPMRHSNSTFCTCCNKPGHEASTCKKAAKLAIKATEARKKRNAFNLQPRGHIGEGEFPVGRPNLIEVFLPQGPDATRDLQNLTAAVVIDARLKKHSHSLELIQASLMSACQTDKPFPLLHLSDARYIIVLSKGEDRKPFLQQVRPKLEKLGLVAYPWSAGIDTEPVDYNFKVWLDLVNVPPQAWNLTHLVPTVSEVGLLLDHTPLESATSLEFLRVVVAVKSLLDIPQAVGLNMRGLRKLIPVKVIGWAHEPTAAANLPVDPTPPQAYFDQLQQNLTSKDLSIPTTLKGKNTVSIDFDVMYNVWVGMPPSEEKDRFEASLRKSDQWDVRRKQELLSSLPHNQASLANPLEIVGTSSNHLQSLVQSVVGQILAATQANPAANTALPKPPTTRKLFPRSQTVSGPSESRKSAVPAHATLAPVEPTIAVLPSLVDQQPGQPSPLGPTPLHVASLEDIQ